jgi:RNA polymerase sigma-70 factor (ECF subfamily)
LGERAVQLSRKPVLSLVSPHYLKTDPIGILLPRVARGDQIAYDLFCEATNGLLFGLLLRILGHTQLAEEVLAEVYDEVRRKAGLFSKQNERPLTWLILIAHRRAIERLCLQLANNSETFYKTRKNTKFTSVPASPINITEQRRLVRATLESITPLQQRMIEGAFFSGMTSFEIAKELGQSPAEVEHEIRCAILQLFGLFESMGFPVGPKPKEG